MHDDVFSNAMMMWLIVASCKPTARLISVSVYLCVKEASARKFNGQWRAMADPAPQQYSSTRCDPNYFDPNYFVLDSSGQSLLF